MDDQNTPWNDQLEQLIGREGLSRPQISRRSGVSTKTITSWLRGDVKSPRRWQPLARVLRALSATAPEANHILVGAGHPPVKLLAERAGEQDHPLLTSWLALDVPFLPPDRMVAELIGRQEYLATATTALRRQQRCVLVGMAGVGKTTLAVELAHRLRDDYADGVFWGNLRTGVADAVLESWGQACGVPMERLTDFNSRAAAMRALFSRKQVLIILDDVLDSRQALQMIPGQSQRCAVLVTTRSEDVARAIAHRQTEMVVHLDPMNRQNSLALLAGILSQQALVEESEHADEVAALLGDMPLALHICAALCADAGFTLAQMKHLLRELNTRLEYLRLEEKPLVRLAFEQSWSLLDEQAQKGLAALAVFAGRAFHTAPFAAVSGLSEPQAALLLTRLYRRSLLSMTRKASTGSPTPEYQQHTLLAAYVAEKLPGDDPAWHRFSTYYSRLIQTPDWWQAAPSETWGNVMAGMATTHRQQAWPLLLAYANHLTEAWRRQGLYSLARQGYAWALEAAQAMADPLAAAEFHLAWGRACLEQSAYAPAQEQFTAALTLFSQQENIAGIATAHYHLARVETEQSNYDTAENAIQQAYRAYQQEEDLRGMGRSLYRLGNVHYYRGEYQQAISLAVDAIRSQQTAADTLGLLRSHMLAAQALTQIENLREAEQHCRVAGDLVEQVDDRAERGAYYYTYAEMLRRQQAFPSAHSYAHKALTIFREMADGSSEVNALLLLTGIEVFWNEAQPERRQYAAGLAYYKDGLMMAEAVGYELGKAFLMQTNGRLLAQMGDPAGACALWLQALEMAEALQHSWLQQRLRTLIDDTCQSH